MEKENGNNHIIWGLGFRDTTPMLENQTEKGMEHEIDTEIQVVEPTLMKQTISA